MLRKFATIGALGLLATIAVASPAAAQRAVRCAEEGGYCSVPYPTTVLYGTRGVLTSRDVGGRGIPCNNGVFGDPLRGVRKHCSYVVREFDGGGRRHNRRFDY